MAEELVNNAGLNFTSSHDKSVQIETSRMISDLPVNLVEEIMCRVPLKHMRAVRLSCKEWDTISRSRRFSKMHIDKIRSRSGESLMIAKMECNLYLMRIVLGEDPFIECQGRLTCTKISQVFHCEGLLLCLLRDDLTKYIVWNPISGQTRSIESRYSHRRDRSPPGWNWFAYSWNWFTYALGYEDKGSSSSCRGYKLLRFIDKFFDTHRDKFSCYEIYDFDSCTWKSLDLAPNSRIQPSSGGVSLKGNTYWLASQRNTGQAMPVDDHIICFDFTSESFGPFMGLPFDTGRDHVSLSCIRDEKLAVSVSRINEGGPLEFEIWISTKIEAQKVSWSKFLRVLEPFNITGDSFFIDEEKKVAMGYSTKTFNIVGEDGYLKKLKFGQGLGIDRNCSVMVSSYVPSLVHINQPAVGVKRKHHKGDD